MITCLGDAMNPTVGAAAVRVSTPLGWAVDFPVRRRRCGRAAFDRGVGDDARRSAKALMETCARLPYADRVRSACGSLTMS